MQSVPIATYEGLFGSEKCAHHLYMRGFLQCKVSPSPYMKGFLAVQSVPIAIYEGLFGSAKCPHRHAKPSRSTLDTKKGYKTKTDSTSSVTLTLTLIKTEYWDRAGGEGNIRYD